VDRLVLKCLESVIFYFIFGRKELLLLFKDSLHGSKVTVDIYNVTKDISNKLSINPIILKIYISQFSTLIIIIINVS